MAAMLEAEAARSSAQLAEHAADAMNDALGRAKAAAAATASAVAAASAATVGVNSGMGVDGDFTDYADVNTSATGGPDVVSEATLVAAAVDSELARIEAELEAGVGPVLIDASNGSGEAVSLPPASSLSAADVERDDAIATVESLIRPLEAQVADLERRLVAAVRERDAAAAAHAASIAGAHNTDEGPRITPRSSSTNNGTRSATAAQSSSSASSDNDALAAAVVAECLREAAALSLALQGERTRQAKVLASRLAARRAAKAGADGSSSLTDATAHTRVTGTTTANMVPSSCADDADAELALSVGNAQSAVFDVLARRVSALSQSTRPNGGVARSANNVSRRSVPARRA